MEKIASYDKSELPLNLVYASFPDLESNRRERKKDTIKMQFQSGKKRILQVDLRSTRVSHIRLQFSSHISSSTVLIFAGKILSGENSLYSYGIK